MFPFLLCSALTVGQAPAAPLPELPPAAPTSPAAAAPLPTAAASPSEGVADAGPRLAGWDNGFFLRSADKQFLLRITGQIQADYRSFATPGDATDFNTFLVRRARLGIEATMAEFYEFRLLPDFGQGTAKVQDAYLNVHYWDQLQFEAGKFKQPFSYEQLIQDRYVPTMEALADRPVGPGPRRRAHGSRRKIARRSVRLCLRHFRRRD